MSCFLTSIMNFWLIAIVSCWINTGQTKKCPTELTLDNLDTLQKLSNSSRLKVDGEFLKPILRKRVSGTKENLEVNQFIQNQFIGLGWHVELDEFKDITPQGEKAFSNIIVTKNPKALKRLVLAAHYDSKYFPPPNDNFVAATDSAVPCALLIDLAHSLDKLLGNKTNKDITLQIVFFDGEEAFETWNNTDSIYGARHLAERWKNQPATSRFSLPGIFASKIDTIEVFVLLDLLGAKGTPISSLKRNTESLYLDLYKLEKNIFIKKLSPLDMNQEQVLPEAKYYAQIDDDHRPFEHMGVSILHIIPAPFPEVWHKLSDNGSIVSSEVVDHLALLFRAFTAQYLCLFEP